MFKKRITDDNYIELLRRKDERALEYVVVKYGGLLRSILRNRLSLIPDMLDECFDDVLMKVWEHADDYDETRCEFKSWLAAIARYRAIDYLRKARREEEMMAGESIDDMVTEPGAADPRIAQIEDAIESEAEQMLSCLSPKDREIFKRIYIDGDSIEEVSRDMDMPKEQVYNHTSRSKKRLRKIYTPSRVMQ
ncbi:MAG: sigma-70 family RNA polymerase sigma factor [Lachnospiraceae bacterium]|nr:sigma-70 family RNA polymerase sigma factor [Lachnospiraceae bacterium]